MFWEPFIGFQRWFATWIHRRAYLLSMNLARIHVNGRVPTSSHSPRLRKGYQPKARIRSALCGRSAAPAYPVRFLHRLRLRSSRATPISCHPRHCARASQPSERLAPIFLLGFGREVVVSWQHVHEYRGDTSAIELRGKVHGTEKGRYEKMVKLLVT